jgi:hypothetical protein
MMACRLLFRQTTARIDSDIDKLDDASDEVDEAIRRIEKTKDVVKAVGKL